MVKPVDGRIDDDSDLRSVQTKTREAQGCRRIEVIGPPHRRFPGGTGEDLRFLPGVVGHDPWQRLVRRSPNQICDPIQSAEGRGGYGIQPADGADDDFHGPARGGGGGLQLVVNVLVGEGADADDHQIASGS